MAAQPAAERRDRHENAHPGRQEQEYHVLQMEHMLFTREVDEREPRSYDSSHEHETRQERPSTAPTDRAHHTRPTYQRRQHKCKSKAKDKQSVTEGDIDDRSPERPRRLRWDVIT